MAFPLKDQIQKKVHWVEKHWHFNKEKVPCTVVSKKGHDNENSVLWYERTHHYWFPWKRCKCK